MWDSLLLISMKSGSRALDRLYHYASCSIQLLEMQDLLQKSKQGELGLSQLLRTY